MDCKQNVNKMDSIDTNWTPELNTRLNPSIEHLWSFFTIKKGVDK